MEFSEFSVRIILIFVPGLISLFIIEYFATIKEIELHRLILYSFLLGLSCYLLYYLIAILVYFINLMFVSHSLLDSIRLFNIEKVEVSFFRSLTEEKPSPDWQEIGLTALLSVLVGCLLTYNIRYKILYRIAKALRMSNKPGDVDVWSYIMNHPTIPKLVIIKDTEKNSVYYGWIKTFSQIKEYVEILLVDVTIYDNFQTKSEKIFYSRGLYLLKKSDNIYVQFPYMSNDEMKEAGNE